MTRPQTLLILTAVMPEAKAIAKALGVACPRPGFPAVTKRGGMNTTLAVVGICAKALPDQAGDLVMMAGLAGALDPKLAIGDVIIDGLGELFAPPNGTIVGQICCSDRIVATPQEKGDLFRRTGALAVEMENDRARAWAGSKGAAFIAIRAISDRADQSLDPAVLRLVDSWGRPKPLAILSTLIRRPALVPHLIRLGRNSRKAAERLGEAIQKMLDDLSANEKSQ